MVDSTANRNYHKRPLLTDINFDFKVNILDIATAAAVFGSYLGHPRWNPIVDIDGNRKNQYRRHRWDGC